MDNRTMIQKSLDYIEDNLQAEITAAELAVGLTVNRRFEVWDYRNVALNFRGQICLTYSLLWIPVCLGAMAIYPVTERLFDISQKTSRKI